MHQFLPKHFTYIYIVEQETKKSKNTLEKGYKFVFVNDCHDDYCRLIWTINLCRGECFKSLRKNERPHNVNSCDKSFCTAGGNGYCNHMFFVFELTELPRTGMCTTQNSSTNQGPRVRTLIHIMHTRHIMSSILNTGRNAEGEMRALRCPLYAARQHTVQNKERAN